MKKVATVVLLFLYAQQGMAQHESAIWYFGDHAGLDFNSGAPVVLENGALNTAEGCATMADSRGNLLFYTDGVTVWGNDHLPMPNGTDLKGHSSSTQSAIIVPAPKNQDSYYIFTTYFQVQGGLYYSEVDLSLHGGRGDVTKKNVLLQNPVTEKITAVKHQNGTDVWVIGHDWGNNVYRAYLVTELGVVNSPVISAVGFSLDYATSGNDVFKSRGYLKASPDGRKLAACHSFVGIELLDFDTGTGKVSGPEVLMQSTGSDFYGLEFSPYADMLYASIINKDIYQFDLKSKDVAASKYALSVPPPMTGALQLALDGKIYVAGSKKLAVIESPEKRGMECGFRPNVIDLGTGHSNYGLPPFITSYFNLGIQAEGLCFGDTTLFSIVATEHIDTAEWDFGDSYTASGENPVHSYDTPGDYTVSVTVQIGTKIKTETRDITIYENPAAFDVSHVRCDSEGTGTYRIDLSGMDDKILNGQDPTQFQVSYYRNEADASAGENALVKETYTNTATRETLFARVEHVDWEHCFALSELAIVINQLPRPVLQERYFTCPDNPYLELDGGNFESWSWRDGEERVIGTSQIMEFTALGNYSLTVTMGQNGTSCGRTVFFELLPSEVPEDFSAQVTHFSEDLTITVQVEGQRHFQYSIDGEHFQEGNQFHVDPGKYTIFVRGKDGCGTLSKEVVALGYRKFFTPNNDGINDLWNIEGGEYFSESRVLIFDRFGKLLRTLATDDKGWDGTYQGLEMPSSDYWFRFEDMEGSVFNAHFSLKR